MSITAHCLVKNEVRFVWYAVMSVLPHVDKVLLWDTGSTDGTLEVINEIQKTKKAKGKINFKEVGNVDTQGFAKVRQKMLEATDTDWFLVVDGDEIWWEESIRRVVQVVKSLPAGKAGSTGRNTESIVVPTINLIGDIYHYQEEAAGQYTLAGRRGHFALRAVKKDIPGLAWRGPHGQGGWADDRGRMIQDRDPKKIIFLDAPYLHTTNLPRARQKTFEQLVPKRTKKLKYEIGIPFPPDFYYPEVFLKPRPVIVPSVWQKATPGYKTRAFFETPFKRIKRRILPSRVGY